jgi:outer membrane protein
MRSAEQTVAFTVASNFLALVQQEQPVRQENLAAQEAQENRFRHTSTRITADPDLYQQQATVAAALTQVVNVQRALELAKVDIIQALNLDPRGNYALHRRARHD